MDRRSKRIAVILLSAAFAVSAAGCSVVNDALYSLIGLFRHDHEDNSVIEYTTEPDASGFRSTIDLASGDVDDLQGLLPPNSEGTTTSDDRPLPKNFMELVDREWADANAPVFKIYSARDLASAVSYVNSYYGDFPVYKVEIMADIDLTGIDWCPMGNTKDDGKHPFNGVVCGNGHTINGMHIEAKGDGAGFIGYSMNATVSDINFTNAYVSSNWAAGIVGGEIIGNNIWSNVHVQGEVKGDDGKSGSLAGYETELRFENCTHDVIVNGEKFDYCSYRDKRNKEIPVVETFLLTLNPDYTITRDEHEGFKSLTWCIYCDGETVLQRNAMRELTLKTSSQWLGDRYGNYEIYLTAWDGEGYVRVSNVIRYERVK